MRFNTWVVVERSWIRNLENWGIVAVHKTIQVLADRVHHLHAMCGRTLIASSIVLLVIPAYAQEQASPEAVDREAGAQAVEEVVVTGSRISRRDYVSQSPIVSVTGSELRETGSVSIMEALGNMPQITPTRESQQGEGGRATISLRGLGSNRNLVLLDGRRLPVSSPFGEVDTNMLPLTVISKVETITGGASAVYGSDAMSGVVNFITEKDFEGVRAELRYGNSAKGDFEQDMASLTAGGKFADGRGRTYVSLGATHRDSLRGKDRFGFYQYGGLSSYIAPGTFVPDPANLPSAAAVTALFTGYGVAAQNVPPSNDRFGFNDDGTLFSQNFGAQNYHGPQYEWLNDNYAITVLNGAVRMPVLVQFNPINSLDQRSIFLKSDYSLNERMTVYVQALANYSQVNTNTGGTLTQYGAPTIPVTNPFIPADLATLLASRPNPGASFTYNRRYAEIAPKNWDEDYYTQQYILGFRGNVGIKDWTYDAYVAWDRVRYVQTQFGAVFLSRVNSLVQAPDGGASLCDGGYNPFGWQNVAATSKDCLDYISGTSTSNANSKRQTYEASMQGSLFGLPAGPVRFSALVTGRKDEYAYTPDKALAEQDIQAVLAAPPIEGKTEVSEVGLELSVPVLKSLSLGLAGRYSDYDLSGGHTTWNIDALWRPIAPLLFRGGYQVAIRAPNIGELFSPATGLRVQFENPPDGGDPCDIRTTARSTGGAQLRQLCIDTGVPASIVDTYIFPTTATTGVFSGNRELKPEQADTYTVGIVFSPVDALGRFGRFSGSVDYFNIKITDVVDRIPATLSLDKCYNLDGSNPNYNANNEYCRLITRGPSGEFEVIRAPYFNLGELSTSGLDVALNWAIDLNVGSTLSLNTLVSFLDSYKVATLPGEAAVDYKGTIGGPGGLLPDWRALTNFGYKQGPFTASLQWYFLPKMDNPAKATNPNSTARGVDSYNRWNLTGTYRLSEGLTAQAGITNLFDADIPLVGTVLGSTNTGAYDVVGRSFYVGVRAEF